MTEEVNKQAEVVELENQPQEKTTQTEQVEYSPAEVEAMELGWQPKEEFDKNPSNEGKRWRSAELFLELKPLYEHTDSVKRQNKQLQKALDEVVTMFGNVQKDQYEKALKDLKAQKRAALLEGETEQALELDDQIEELREKKPETKKELKADLEDDSQAIEWMRKNGHWYTKDEDAREYADLLAVKYSEQGKSVQEVLDIIGKKVKQRFPDLFINPRKENAPKVEQSRSGNLKSESFKLTPLQERIMDKVLASGVGITREEYIRQLKEQQ